MANINSNNQPTYTSMRTGAICGATMGIVDVYATNAWNQHQNKKIIKEFKKVSFSEKKLVIETINNLGMTLKEYKEIIKKTFEPPSIKTTCKRALLYGGILASIGLLLDIKEKNKSR